MNQLEKNNKIASNKILEIKSLISAIEIIEQNSYPTNTLLNILNWKIKRVFDCIEKNRKILKIK